jgi:hypothetical protein
MKFTSLIIGTLLHLQHCSYVGAFSTPSFRSIPLPKIHSKDNVKRQPANQISLRSSHDFPDDFGLKDDSDEAFNERPKNFPLDRTQGEASDR